MRGLEIDVERGMYHAYTADGKSATATSCEALLARLDPGAPPEKIAAAAEIFEGIIAYQEEVE
jgi:hypothetical protein